MYTLQKHARSLSLAPTPGEVVGPHPTTCGFFCCCPRLEKKEATLFFFAALVIIRLCQDGVRARKVVPQNCDELLIQLQRRRTTTNGCKLIPVMIFRTGMIRGISRDGIESARFCCAEESLSTSREGGRFR